MPTDDLPDANTDEGALARLLLVEVGNQPKHQAGVKEAMGLMKKVLENRLKKPIDFYAAGATTMTQIIRAHKADGSGVQFRGFQGYPTLASAQQGELTDDLEKRDLVAAAIAVAKATAPSDPSPGGRVVPQQVAA